MGNNAARILYHETFDGRGFTNENSLVNAYLINPDNIDPVITHLLGKKNKKFPLSFLSEGQGGTGDMSGSIGLNDIQLTYDVINRIDKPDYIVSCPYQDGDKIGLGGVPFFFTTRTNWLKYGYNIEFKSGKQARIIDRPVQDGVHWRYTAELWINDLADYLEYSDLTPASKVGMVGGANVAQSLSMGNESNVVAPGKMKQQISFLRKSYRLAGNISNKTVEVQFNIDSKLTNLWMNWEQWLHLIQWKQDVEEHSWYSEYNRLPDGTILNKDRSSGLPIPRMAGALDQIPNSDTYSFLTAKKIKNTVRDVMYGATDTGAMDVVLFTGIGGLEEFDSAMKEEAAGFTQIVGDKFITGAGRNLVLGGYFTQYQHIDGHVVTVKQLPLLDHGGRAQIARRHPITGLPITSYDMYFLDLSVYDGKRNLVMLHENGRSMITGVLRGMAAVPQNFAGNSVNINLATEQDLSSIHFMCSKGILIRRNTHCFKLTCDLS
jgi:hypothetical protein